MISSSNSILNDVNFGDHALSKRAEPRRDELELDLEDLLLHNGRDEDLDLQVEHVVARNRLANLKEIFLATAIVVIDEETAGVPIVLRVVEHLELDESRLACLHSCMVLISLDSFLLWHMLYEGEILDGRSSLGSEHTC